MGTPEQPVAREREVLELLSTTAKLLFADGQTTERTVAAVERLAGKLGFRGTVIPGWSAFTIRIEGTEGTQYAVAAVEPLGVDMSKVVAANKVIDDVCDGDLDVAALGPALESVGRIPPVWIVRFAIFAALGAAALGVIFGDSSPVSLGLIAFSAGTGACLRRWLAGKSHSPFLQPFCAALLAGVIGAIAVRLNLSSSLRLVAVCPCMVLVPGPHFLNGTLDLLRARLVLGGARIALATLITLMICAGLLIGLALGGTSLPPAAPGKAAPFLYDVLAAGVAVAAYGSFFSMPWRMMPFPILIGMLAHACRWGAMSFAGADAVAGAFVACLVVGVIITPIADRLRLPFAGVAFASVVSLVPGVFLFRMASGMVEIVKLGSEAPQQLSGQVISDGATALLIIVAMTFGLIVPKLCIQHFSESKRPAKS